MAARWAPCQAGRAGHKSCFWLAAATPLPLLLLWACGGCGLVWGFSLKPSLEASVGGRFVSEVGAF